MNLKKIETTVAPEAHDFGVAFKKVMSGIKAAKADGKVDAGEVLQSLTGALSEFVVAANGVMELPAEAKGNPMAFARALVVPVTEGVEEFLA